jgi:hypothetical protein
MDPPLPGSWQPTPKQEQTKQHPKQEQTKQHPKQEQTKQHPQPVVPESSAAASRREDADSDGLRSVLADVILSLQDLKVEVSTLKSEWVPRVTALEALTMDAPTPHDSHRDRGRGKEPQDRRRDDSPLRRRSRDKRASSRYDKARGPSRGRRRRDDSESPRGRRRHDDSESPRRRRRDRDDEDDYGSHRDRRPRLRTDSLPTVRYGEDVTMWLLDMDYIIQKHGEEIVCPEIFSHCFQSGDAIKLWFMSLDPGIREHYTTGSGCWKRFRGAMERRFTADIAMRQLAAEDRSRLPSETYAEFAIKKLALIKTSFAHLAEAAMIAMVKRKLDLAAAQFCREETTVDAFVSELIAYDNLRALHTGRRLPPRSTQQTYSQPYSPAEVRDSGPSRYQQAPYGQPSNNAPAPSGTPAYVDPRSPTVQLRKDPATGRDTLSYLDRSGKTVFIQRPCGHCEAAGKRNAWHFDFACANKPQGLRRARTYAAATDLPGTFESPSGLPTSYTFSNHAVDPDPDREENPFSIDDVEDESGNGEWGQ